MVATRQCSLCVCDRISVFEVFDALASVQPLAGGRRKEYAYGDQFAGQIKVSHLLREQLGNVGTREGIRRFISDKID